MTTAIVDPTFQPGRYIFGFSLPGLAYFGNARSYPQKAIFGIRPLGSQIAGLDVEEEMFAWRYGVPIPRSTGPWPVTPFADIRVQGKWAKRIIYYTWRGQQRIKRHSPQHSCASENIVPTMLKLMEASVIWHLFDDTTKRRLDSDASHLGLRYTGYNYFIKLYIQDNPKWETYV